MLGTIARWADETMHPAWYHAAIARPPYFEGWYYKFVSADQRSRFAVIPGVFRHHDKKREHAFIQIFDGSSGRATYHRFPAEQFRHTPAPGGLRLTIGENRFSLGSVHLRIADEQRTVTADIQIDERAPWPVALHSPGIMGPFGWLPIMECYHGVLSLDHGLGGGLTDDGVPHDFTGGRGYIEKDWGRSFPAAWVWMQTNHFAHSHTSLTASVAITPLLGGWFPGFIVGMWHMGRLHRFTTYTGARSTALEVDGARVRWVMRGRNFGRDEWLEILATRAEASILPGPSREDMGKRVPETLRAEVAISLSPVGGGTAYEDVGRCAGLEVAGEIERLQAAIRA